MRQERKTAALRRMTGRPRGGGPGRGWPGWVWAARPAGWGIKPEPGRNPAGSGWPGITPRYGPCQTRKAGLPAAPACRNRGGDARKERAGQA